MGTKKIGIGKNLGIGTFKNAIILLYIISRETLFLQYRNIIQSSQRYSQVLCFNVSREKVTLLQKQWTKVLLKG